MRKLTKIFNGNIIAADRIINGGCILLDDNKIAELYTTDVELEDAAKVDADGLFISPGFIDIHVHGGGNRDFIEGVPEAVIAVAEAHAKHGTTSLLAGLSSNTDERLKNAIDAIHTAKCRNKQGANLIGIHLEGPYLSSTQIGAMNPDFLKLPKRTHYEKILSWTDDIKRWSIAPELPGVDAFAKFIASKGVLPAIAHSDATYEQVKEAYECGFTHITHLYSSMSSVRRINAYRYAGIVEAAYLIDGMTAEIIADGCHLPASLLTFAYKFKGSDKLALVTDAIPPAGTDISVNKGTFFRNGLNFLIEDGVAKTEDRKSFAGSIATTDRLVRNMINMAGVSIIDAVKMATATPAKIMGLNSKGFLKKGYDADLVFFNNDIDIKRTVIGGATVYNTMF